MSLTVGLPAGIMPPADRVIEMAKRNEAQGFDAVWWPDHLMGWHPDALWTEDVTPLAEVQPNPHVYFDPLVMMGLVGAATERLRVGVVVTDVIRRPAPVLAQTMLTLDHATKGRSILGLGSGERLNVSPYGLPFDRPVTRLSEGIDVIRLLWEADGPVDYEGRYHHLDRAVLGMSPYGDAPPEIWTAAHGPRMLSLTGAKADGWLPTKVPLDTYRSQLERIRKASVDAGRPEDVVTPGLLSYVLVGPDPETVEELKARPLVRALCVLLPSETFRELGVTPPLEGSGSGFHDFVPTDVDRAEAMRIVEAIPPKVVEHYAFCGTPEQVVESIRPYAGAGMEHLILWNVTPFADPGLTGWSFKALAEIREALR